MVMKIIEVSRHYSPIVHMEYNPHNGIIEQVHQVLMNALMNFIKLRTELENQNPWDKFYVQKPSRSKVHTTCLWRFCQLN